MRSSILRGALAVLLAASPLTAQRLDRRAVAPTPALEARTPVHVMTGDTAHSASRAAYVLGGAAAGAAIAGIGFLVHDESDDGFFYGAVVVTVVTASALVGASIGWIVYAIRH